MTRTVPRRGFTLVELLVAIALAIVILSLAVYLVNSATFESYKVVGAGDRLSQWLMTAKNRALRDKVPRGVRLIINNGFATEAVYIEQPDPWVPATGTNLMVFIPSTTTANPPTTQPTPRFFLFGVTLTDFQAVVGTGDFLFVPDWRKSYKITNIQSPQGGAPTSPLTPTVELTLASPLPDLGSALSDQSVTPNATTATVIPSGGFLFYRQAQPLLGEPTLQIASGMAVDVKNSIDSTGSSATLGLTSATTQYDILFSPNGELVNSNGSMVGLLLRDTNKFFGPANLTTSPTDYDKLGEMVIVVVYARTGAIATQPVANSTGTGIFQFVRDAVNTGV